MSDDGDLDRVWGEGRSGPRVFILELAFACALRGHVCTCICDNTHVYICARKCTDLSVCPWDPPAPPHRMKTELSDVAAGGTGAQVASSLPGRGL